VNALPLEGKESTPQDEECDPLLDAAVRALALSQTLIVMPAKAGIQ
jgi:hypothetical protein